MYTDKKYFTKAKCINTDDFEKGKRCALEDVFVGILGFITVEDAKKLEKLTLKLITRSLKNITKCGDCQTVDEILNKSIYDYKDFIEVYEKANRDTQVEIAKRVIELKLLSKQHISDLTELSIEYIEKIEKEVTER